MKQGQEQNVIYFLFLYHPAVNVELCNELMLLYVLFPVITATLYGQQFVESWPPVATKLQALLDV